MAPAPASEDELARILALECTQRVNLTTPIAYASPARRETTSYGQKDIVGAAFVDGPTHAGREGQVAAQTALFFETSARGATKLKSLRYVLAPITVVALCGVGMHPAGRRALRVYN